MDSDGIRLVLIELCVAYSKPLFDLASDVPPRADGEPLYAKRWVLREHLVPAFGKRRLDEIGPADVEAYKPRKLKDGQAAKSVNNLCVLRKSSTWPSSGASSPTRRA